jgi:hypothetical protein
MYIGKISEINLKESKSGNGPMLEVILQPVKTADGKTVKPKDKKKQVARVYTYVLLEHEPSDWKLKEFIKAVSLKDKGMIDTDKLVNTEVQMNLKPDTDLNDQYRPRVGKLMAVPNGAKSRPAPAAPETNSTPDDEEEVEDYTRADLDEMEDDELIEAAGEFDVPVPKGRMNPIKKRRLIDAILEAQEEGDEDEDEEDEEDEEDDTDVEASEEEDEEDDDEEDEREDEEDEEESDQTLAEELDRLNRSELKAYIKEHELDISVKKSMEDEDIRDAIVEAVGDEDEDEEEDEEGDEPTDYNSWSIDALKKEAQERGLSTKGSKKILAGRLGKDDEDEDNPF